MTDEPFHPITKWSGVHRAVQMLTSVESIKEILEKFRCDLIDGKVIKESDGDPWPLTKSESQQIVDELAKRFGSQ